MARQRSSTRDDFDRLKDSAHKLRSENRRLRKQNSLLRKQLNQISERISDLDFDVESEDLISVPSDSAEKLFCPKCRSDEVEVINAGIYLIRVCKCGYRKRFKRE